MKFSNYAFFLQISHDVYRKKTVRIFIDKNCIVSTMNHFVSITFKPID